jgi:hypothetical protein
MVEHHVALLHGVVDTQANAREIERAVGAMSGVRGVELYLHVGIGASDTRPSGGRQAHEHEPSLAKQSLLSAAVSAGVDDSLAPTGRPGDLGDVRRTAPRWRTRSGRCSPSGRREVPARPTAPHTMREAGSPRRRADRQDTETTAELPAGRATEVTQAVLQALRTLVPDEAADVAALLPLDIRRLWQPNRLMSC